MNNGVDLAALRQEFGSAMLEPAMQTVERLVDDGLLIADSERVHLTSRGRLLSNDVFREFLRPEVGSEIALEVATAARN